MLRLGKIIGTGLLICILILLDLHKGGVVVVQVLVQRFVTDVAVYMHDAFITCLAALESF